MEKVEIKLYNMDKPNRNGRYYSKEVIDEALKNLNGKPIFLLDSMPDISTFDSTIDLRRVIGKCVDVRWEDAGKTLAQTFEITDKRRVENKFPCLFGKGDVEFDSQGITIVKDFQLDGFALADICAWESSIKMMPQTRVAIVPGSFDPITIGHLDIIQKAANIYDKVYVAVMINDQKHYTFTLEQREEIARAAVKDMDNVKVISSSDWLWKLAAELDACAIVKGYRNKVDLEYEQKMAEFNAEKNPKARTVLLKAEESLVDVSSTRVREMMRQNESLEGIVPQSSIEVMEKIRAAKF